MVSSPTDFGDLAPNFDITIENKRIADGVRAVIESVEYESTDGMADMCKLNVTNVADDSGRFRLSDSRVFMPGNEMSLFIGYGPALRHVGRTIIRKVRNVFPAGGMPTLEVIGYTKDVVLADNAPEALMELKKSKAKNPKKPPGLKKSKAGRRFKDSKFSDAVEDRAADYGLLLDVDPTPDPPHDFIQKAGMSDYDFIQGLSNLTGYYFWIDGDASGEWTIHFKDPAKLTQADIQEKEYTFQYNLGDFSTLLSFEPELAIQGSLTKLIVEAKDPLTGEIMEVKISDEEEDADGPDPVVEASDQVSPEGNDLELSLTSNSDIKIFSGDFSFDVRTNRRFKSEAELAAWAIQWFRRNKENFILSQGTSIGIESLMARQIHRIAGLGVGLDGKYQFTRVRHTFNAGGYLCDFSVRKLVTGIPAPQITSTVQEIPVSF